MLRYIYLITLLQCIELTFSYNYIDDALGSNSYKTDRPHKKLRKSGGKKVRKAIMHQEINFKRSPVEFDLASFIQPDDMSIDEDSYRNSNKKRPNILRNQDFGTIIGLNADQDSQIKDTNTDYFNILSNNAPEFKDPLKSKHLNIKDLQKTKYSHDNHLNIYNDEKFATALNSHHPEKKCALRHMKFPFFSHNKTASTNSKKKQKRKLFCFNCPKRKNKIEEPIQHHKIKRSYIEKLCPACRKKYIVDLQAHMRKKKTTNESTSNKSYVKSLKNLVTMKDDKILSKNNENINKIERTKREETTREKYMRILEDVQRKIDNVPVNVSHFIRT